MLPSSELSVSALSSASRRWIACGALVAAAGVAMGAFGAHGLADNLGRWGYAGEDLARRLAIFETAARYQMYHAIGIVLAGVILALRPSRAARAAAWAMLCGVVVFSGLLYVLVCAGPSWSWLGAIVPIGGVAMIVGWLLLAAGVLISKD